MCRDQCRLVPTDAARFARLALDCIDREYPNAPQTLLIDESDLKRPREQTPAFFGCFDWHSAVHGHWTLVRMTRLFPDEAWSEEARMALRQHLSAANLATELRYLSKPGREGFERPYGLAWLLQLAAELRDIPEAEGAAFVDAIAPLEQLCRDRLATWLPKLTAPIRSGEHSQTAFAMGLAFDWATAVEDAPFADLLKERALTFYAGDRDLPLRYEPSGHDFLSPALAEADLLRRVLPAEKFAAWLATALPDLFAGTASFEPAITTDRADGKLAHLDGLNLSRAWMLEGIASGLPSENPARQHLAALAEAHALASLPAVTGTHYAGSHWLASFATYLLSNQL